MNYHWKDSLITADAPNHIPYKTIAHNELQDNITEMLDEVNYDMDVQITKKKN